MRAPPLRSSRLTRWDAVYSMLHIASRRCDRGAAAMLDLQGFLEVHRREIGCVRRPVRLDEVGALTAQAAETIVFERLAEHPRFRLVDHLFVHRRAQARILGCEPGQVVPTLAGLLRRGPRPLVIEDG